jgi:hypothetical protein
MTGIVIAVGVTAAGIFGLGLLAGMVAGTLILRRGDRLDARHERMARAARRLTGSEVRESPGR